MESSWWEIFKVDIANFFSWASATAGVSVAYEDLPQPPTPEPPTQTSIEAMDPAYQAEFRTLESELTIMLASIGWALRRLETKRTNARQAWLYQIGRSYQAPGRTGIVTDVPTAHGPHGEGRAIDYLYVPAVPGSKPDADQLNAVLDSVAESHPEMTWGGNFSLSDGSGDPAHWERKV